MEKQIKEQFDAINRYIKLQNNLFQQVAAKIGISNTELYILIFLCRSDEICTQNDNSGKSMYAFSYSRPFLRKAARNRTTATAIFVPRITRFSEVISAVPMPLISRLTCWE